MSHQHGHNHDVSAPVAQSPGLSLLRLSAAHRLGYVLLILIMLWGAVLWALGA